MRGLDIVARTLSQAVPMGASGDAWQYHPRSDRHSKVACWAILFDLLCTCSLLAKHVGEQAVCFGINHEMSDFRMNRKKNLDLVLCTPGSLQGQKLEKRAFSELALEHGIVLDDGDLEVLRGLPRLARAPVGNVLVALEAKACMTEHLKARPRLYDELNSSQQTVHGASDLCIAAGFVMINAASRFRSPTRKEAVSHDQPRVTEMTIEKIRQLPRRTTTGVDGFDAVAITVVECENDPSIPFSVLTAPPAPALNDPFHYDQMIRRTAQLYESRFPRT